MKWISGVSTEMVLQISSPEKVLQKRLYRKGFILRVSEELKEAKFRTEALKQKSFLKYTQQVFSARVHLFLVGILSEDTRRILQLLLSRFWKIQEVQAEKKRHKKNMLSSSEGSVRGLAFLVKEEKKGYYISKWTRVRLHHAVCQRKIGHKGVYHAASLLQDYSSLFNGSFVEERSIIILWEISKTEYYIGASDIFGQVYKGFKLKKEVVEF